jgi:peptidoglycan/xylan/chitin deacetylase (PgdA/CDA1 family)
VLARTTLKLLSPEGPRGRLSVLLFHRVLARPDPLFPEEVDARRFDEICTWLAAWFNIVALDDGVRQLQSRTLPERALAITFDDGYADNHDIALPILRKHRFPATFFIATGFIDGGLMWNDVVIEAMRHTSLQALQFEGPAGKARTLRLGDTAERRAAINLMLGELKYLPAEQRSEIARQLADRADVRPSGDTMLTSQQIKNLRAAGMQIGAHTVSHPILATLDRASALREIGESKRFLEQLLGEPIGLFAYPNGKPSKDFTLDDVSLARALGFDVAVSTAPGAASIESDPLQLPRFTPWDRRRMRFGARLVHNLWASRSSKRSAETAT